jgi:signal transduction histidine kinase
MERNRSGNKQNRARGQEDFYIDLLCHDINNMNQVAIGYMELAIENVKQGICDPALLAKPMAVLKDSSKLLDSVRKIQRVKAGGQRLETVDLGRLLEGIVAQYSSIPDRDVTLRYVPVEGRMVIASELLKDVFNNLIGNAIKHSSGPVTISICLAEISRRGKNYHRVDIADDGPGIPDAMKAKVFERFARGSTRAMGKGLGLYLVKALIDSFHGRVWVEDRVKGDYRKGCNFVVVLPADKGHPS